ncbi:hypothetical protein QBC38DRAFT_169950 [Podospora fimiseda]|uniref:Uncharacterized protein n=1 Tax=Podospora fimiseda TaxID=252190 RepID=A0AAN7BR47_9PEZI|nr:hypothetical protein QBC38DRAFT_169950 [Podospora fimiseda]
MLKRLITLDEIHAKVFDSKVLDYRDTMLEIYIHTAHTFPMLLISKELGWTGHWRRWWHSTDWPGVFVMHHGPKYPWGSGVLAFWSLFLVVCGRGVRIERILTLFFFFTNFPKWGVSCIRFIRFSRQERKRLNHYR